MLYVLKGLVGLIALCITSCCFLGFLPGIIIRKPGTYGELMGSLIGLGLLIYIFLVYNQSIELVIALILGTFLLGIFFINLAEKLFYLIFGHKPRLTGNKYASSHYNHTIIDEVHGQLIAGLPIFFIQTDNWLMYIVAFSFSFICFRTVNSTWFIKQIKYQFKGTGIKQSFGIISDDTVSGIISAFLLSLLSLFLIIL